MGSYRADMKARGRELTVELDHAKVYAVREKGSDRIKHLAAKMFVLKSTHPLFTHTLCYHDLDRGHMMEGMLLGTGDDELAFRLQVTPDGETLINAQVLHMAPLTLAEFNEHYRDSVDPHRRFLNTIDDIYTWYLRHVPEP